MKQAIDVILENAISSGRFLGVSFVAIDKKGNTLYSGANGNRDFAKTEAMTVGTVGFIASMTKLLTSIAVMQLVERGLIGLDDDLGAIVPDLGNREILVSFDEQKQTSKMEKPTVPITLRLLLTHSSGFVYDKHNAVLKEWSTATGKIDEFWAGDWKAYVRPLVFNPGTSWVYGLGIDWAGRVVETLTKQSLEDYMQENIWSKVGMKNTTFRSQNRASFPKMEMGLRGKDPYGPLEPIENPFPVVTSNDFGGAGLYSTAEDYGRFLGALLSDNELLLKRDSLDEFIKPQLTKASHEALRKDRLGHYVQVDVPGDIQVDHSLGGIVLLEDIPGRKKKGSIFWDGMTNPCWMLDRTSGIATTLFVQILPSQDLATKELWVELETAVYAHVKR